MLITLRTNMENQSWNATAAEPAGPFFRLHVLL